MVWLDARYETTGESYVIRGSDEYERLVELAEQVGFELALRVKRWCKQVGGTRFPGDVTCGVGRLDPGNGRDSRCWRPFSLESSRPFGYDDRL